MRIVVTGGAGFIGSVLTPRLLAQGHRVHVVDNLMYGAQPILPFFFQPGFSFAEVDVRDRAALARELAGADVVIHLAALTGYPLCKKLPREAVEVNLGGATNVIELAPADARLVYASTGSNYGEVIGVCTEDTPLNPLSLYGETKTQAEQLFVARDNTVSLRFATAFGIGPRLRLDLMINDFTYQALHNRFLVIYEKHFRRTFLHVQDIARAIVHVVEHPDRLQHKVYNVGHDTLNYTKAEIVELLRRRLDFLVHFAEIGTDEDKRDYEVSYARIRATGFEPEVDIDRGLDEVIRALRLMRIRNPYSNV
ncbi:NAD(P)-dependent oxidoreductase [Myxococcota bacterium]|nr:NAD(P)-dependent oxidoreductase [Myxococcota bacterium]